MQARTIAVIGGTGKEGSGLALRWAHAGHRVLIGSRSVDRADDAARTINAQIGTERAAGMNNLAAAQGGDIVVLTVPYAAQIDTLDRASELRLPARSWSTSRCRSSRRKSAACNCPKAARPSSTRRKCSGQPCA